METLQHIHDKIKGFLYFEDTRLIDLILAVFISRQQRHSKLWIIIIGVSGDGKSELVNLFQNDLSVCRKSITSNSLVNGKKNKSRFPDFAPFLKDKILILPEMAQILTLPTEEKQKIWAQFRDLYDGLAGRTSAEGNFEYTGLNVSFLGCSTPNIDNQVLIHNALGTRELLYRIDAKDKDKLMDRIISNSVKDKETMRQVITESIREFLKEHDYKDIEIKEEVLAKIRNWAVFVCNMRVTADINYHTGQVKNRLSPEQPSRVLEQFLVLYRSLKSLDHNYTDTDALELIKKLAVSSCQPNRISVLYEMLSCARANPEGMSKNTIATKLGLDPDTIFAEQNTLALLGMMKKEDTCVNYQTDRYYRKFYPDYDNELVKFIQAELVECPDIRKPYIEEKVV